MRVAYRILAVAVLLFAIAAPPLRAFDILRVSVTNEAGQPIPKARVSLVCTSRSKFVINRGVLYMWTTRTGRAEFVSLLEGTYTLSVSAPGYSRTQMPDLRVRSAIVVRPRIKELDVVLKPLDQPANP